jgi:hypothetical protein
MLISHICRFIYLKTRKTAGTSVEIYFEPYCVDPKNRPGDIHNRAAVVSNWGVVGSRGSANSSWYNHMSAAEIRRLTGPEIWESYYKFCVVRNPFDKVVSYFWHDITTELREEYRCADFGVVRKAFAEWTGLRRFPIDAWIYTDARAPVVNDFIRYERLHEDIRAVCGRLAIPWQPERLGRYKSEYRKRAEPFAEYYTSEAASRVEETFEWELDHLGYAKLTAGLPGPSSP